MLSTSFHAKMPKLYFGQISWLVGPKGVFEQGLINFFFLAKDFSISFLELLNKISISFRAKTSTLYSGQNSWPIGPRGIFKKILIEFFFLQNIFPVVSWTSEYAIHKFSCKNTEIVFR